MLLVGLVSIIELLTLALSLKTELLALALMLGSKKKQFLFRNSILLLGTNENLNWIENWITSCP